MDTDDEQLEKLKQWWKENGAFIVIGVALGFATLFGWRWWGEYREAAFTEASTQYERLRTLAEEGGSLVEMEAIWQALRASRVDTPYADIAALELARHAVDIGDHDAAMGHLREVLDATRDDEVAHTARLRLARVHLSIGDHAGAGSLLADRDTGAFEPLYDELRGDLASVRGDRARAIEAYREALAGAGEGIADRAILEMKLDDLGASRPGADS